MSHAAHGSTAATPAEKKHGNWGTIFGIVAGVTAVLAVILTILWTTPYFYPLIEKMIRGEKDSIHAEAWRDRTQAADTYEQRKQNLRAAYYKSELTDAEFVRKSAEEKIMYEHRVEVANNPNQEVCNFQSNISGNVRTYNIPPACLTGFEFMVWPDSPQKTVKAELLTSDGDVIEEVPEFRPGRGSTASCNATNKRCVFDGVVLYHHLVGGKHRTLRITIQ